MSNRSWLWLLVGLGLSLAPLSHGQVTVLQQTFDAIPEGFVGRYGSVTPGPSPYGTEGRWSEFGEEAGTPRVQAAPERSGHVVLLSRIEEGSLHPLIGSFNPLQSLSRIRMECDIWVPQEGAIVASINSRNTQAASVLLRTQEPGIAIWNSRDGRWETTNDRVPSGQWLRLAIDCDFSKESYTVALLDEDGFEVFSAQGLLGSDVFGDEGLNNILFNPQSGLSENFMIDQVLVTAWY